MSDAEENFEGDGGEEQEDQEMDETVEKEEGEDGDKGEEEEEEVKTLFYRSLRMVCWCSHSLNPGLWTR